jgi:hypothetical protein
MVSPLALLSARLIQQIGTRNAAFLGSIIFGTGLLAASFATNSLPWLFITVGFMAGTGVALVFMASHRLAGQRVIILLIGLLRRLHRSYRHNIFSENVALRRD